MFKALWIFNVNSFYRSRGKKKVMSNGMNLWIPCLQQMWQKACSYVMFVQWYPMISCNYLNKEINVKVIVYQLLLKMQCLLVFGVRNPILNTRSNLYLWKTTMIIKRKLLCTKGHKESIIHYIKVMLPNTQHSCLSGRHRQHTAKWSLLKIPFFMSNSWD